jgi:hypothetical protein
MPYEIEREEREKEELYEYMHWKYLNEKYGE